MSEEVITKSEEISEIEESENEDAVITNSKLTPEEQIDFLKRKLEQAEMEATDKGIALIEMTASRNALYKSLQDTQMRLAEEKRQLQEQYDALVIKAKRYDELQESLVKIKMKAELRAHGVIDEAQEKAMDTIMLIDDIEKEISLFREDVTYLRRDIKIGTVTLDDRLENVYLRLCKSLDRLIEIKENFYIKNSLPLDDDAGFAGEGKAPTLHYPEYVPGSEGDDEEQSCAEISLWIKVIHRFCSQISHSKNKYQKDN